MWYLTRDFICELLVTYFPGPAEKSNAKSVFDLGEITRLMKFPGVAKTFTVKIISGLPSGGCLPLLPIRVVYSPPMRMS